MNTFSRLVVLAVMVASSLAALSSSAGAVTWHNTGSTAFTATGGLWTLTVTGSTGTTTVSCTATSATGTAPGGSTVAPTYTIPGTLVFSPCTFVGQNSYVHCGYSFTGLVESAGATAGTIDLSCTLRLTASNTPMCRIAGSTFVNYYNPSVLIPGNPSVSTYGALVLQRGVLQVTRPTGTSCPLAHGTSSVLTGHVERRVVNVSNGSPTATGPVITRTV